MGAGQAPRDSFDLLDGQRTSISIQVRRRFEALNEELGRWLPEFDRILFDTPQEGHRVFRLRTRSGSHSLPADELSQDAQLLLAAADGKRTLARIAADTALGEFEATRVAYRLVVAGLLVLDE